MKIEKSRKKVKIIFLFAIVFSILFMALVSALPGCCVETNISSGGAFCDYVEESDCNDTLPYHAWAGPGESCDAIEFTYDRQCTAGCCIDYENGLCDSSGTKKYICTKERGLIWEEGDCDDLAITPNPCEEKCCVVNGKGDYITQRACELISDPANINFTDDFDEEECDNLYRSGTWVACVIGNSCTYKKYEECNGDFRDMYCSDQDIKDEFNIYCDANEDERCDPDIGDNVYWFDSCGTFSGVKTNCTQGEEECALEDGVYDCKSFNCTGEGHGGENLISGESICVYDGSFGKGYDPAGSIHWRKTCYRGEITYNSCGEGRVGICQETNTTQTGVTAAICVPNRVEECFAITAKYNAKMNSEGGGGESEGKLNTLELMANRLIGEMKNECGNNTYCTMKEYNIPSGVAKNYFGYAMCVPKDSKNMSEYCKLATQSCVMYLNDDFWGETGFVANSGCIREEIFEKMNDLCISMGDCGLYVNYQNKTGHDKLSYSPVDPTNPARNKDLRERTIKYRAPCGIIAQDSDCDHEDECEGAKCYTAGMTTTTEANWCCENEAGVDKGKFAINLPKFIIPLAEALIATAAGPGKNIISEEPLNFSWPDDVDFPPEDPTPEAINAIMEDHMDDVLDWTTIDFTHRKANTFVGSTDYLRGQKKADYIEGANVPGWGLEDPMRNTIVKYNCLPWTPPMESTDCELCNDGPTPCTEYKCQSLGACMIINEDSEPNFACISREDDGMAPNITDIYYTGEGYNITGSGSNWETVYPNDITSMKPFPEGSKMYFNVTLDEHAQCRWDYKDSPDYASMDFPSDTTGYLKEHSFEIDVLDIDYFEVDAENCSNLTIRCADLFSHSTPKTIIKYCISAPPDTEAPVVESWDPDNGKIWQFMPDNFTLTISLDEDVTNCSYDNEDRDYSNMDPYNMNCIDGTECRATINTASSIEGLNYIYIRCNDTSGNINPTSQVYEYTIVKDISETQYETEFGLRIASIKLEMDGVEYSDEANLTSGAEPEIDLVVLTERGADGYGTAKCSWGVDSAPDVFFSGTGHTHTKTFQYFQVGHTLYVECDDGIITATANITFNLTIDTQKPIITFNTEPGFLTVTTHKLAKCAYAPSDFSDIEDGEDMDDDFVLERIIAWDPGRNYFTRCVDPYGNENDTRFGNASITGPKYTRIYYESGKLKINTDVLAKCYYGFNDCTFMIPTDETLMGYDEFSQTHSVEWFSARTYYIRCMDEYENKNPYNECAVIVQANSLN